MHFRLSQPADQANAKPWLLGGKRKSFIAAAASNAVSIARATFTKSLGKPLAYLPFTALAANLPWVLWIMSDTYYIMIHDTQGVRSASHFWSDGSATNPPIKEFSPTIVFDAAFEGGQSVGPASDQQSLSLLIQKWNPPPAQGLRVRTPKPR